MRRRATFVFLAVASVAASAPDETATVAALRREVLV
jgi:hypothetical protein